ncbi:MAG TPA: SIMPL domain-containing protein [Steroidobacteraceae bacterium]|nr:SIMPL domain-containing protein [Steroidobacteraceae bacterium]
MKHSSWIAASLASTALLLGTQLVHADEIRRSINVSGQGEVKAEPDRATVTLGIEARKPKMEDARNEVAKGVDAVLKLTRELKIDPKLVRATRINIQPEYNWDNNARERNLIGYYVTRQIEVDLRDLEKLGTLIERAVDLGVNQIGDPQLDSSRRRDLERDALAKAVEDAHANAEAVAKAAGARVGAPRVISANSGFVPPPQPMQFKVAAARMEGSDAGQSYQSGQLGFTANVQVEYELIVNSPANP